MDVVVERCAGLDVHQATVAAGVRLPGRGGERTPGIQTFGTTTPDLLTLRDWLAAHLVTHVAMESTGGPGTPSTTSSTTRGPSSS